MLTSDWPIMSREACHSVSKEKQLFYNPLKPAERVISGTRLLFYHDVLPVEQPEEFVGLEVQVFWKRRLFLGVLLQGGLGQCCGLGGFELALKVICLLIRQMERWPFAFTFLGLAVERSEAGVCKHSTQISSSISNNYT